MVDTLRSVVLITGISGSGKSVALKWLEDAGYACVDNLPVQLLQEFIAGARESQNARVAVAIDARSQGDLSQLPDILSAQRAMGTRIRVVFLDADDHTLVQRYSESRRQHPLAKAIIKSGRTPTLRACIELERDLLDRLRTQEHVVDTSNLKPGQLRDWMRDFIEADRPGLILTLESFAFRQGAARDADLVFDVRCLPNPHYDPQLSPLTGCDEPVATWLAGFDEVKDMIDDIEAFTRKWLPRYTQDTRSYLTLAIGCTGGQHRSVYVVEELAKRFSDMPSLVVRHRQQPDLKRARNGNA
ncbi:MAG: RNase adapter RapZ [Orrella sp.]